MIRHFGDKLLMIRLVVVGCSPFGQFGHVLGLCVVCRDFRGNFSSCRVHKFGFWCRNTRGFCVGKNYDPQLDNGWTQGFWLEYEVTCSSCFVLILIVACAANQLVVLLCRYCRVQIKLKAPENPVCFTGVQMHLVWITTITQTLH